MHCNVQAQSLFDNGSEFQREVTPSQWSRVSGEYNSGDIIYNTTDGDTAPSVPCPHPSQSGSFYVMLVNDVLISTYLVIVI